MDRALELTGSEEGKVDFSDDAVLGVDCRIVMVSPERIIPHVNSTLHNLTNNLESTLSLFLHYLSHHETIQASSFIYFLQPLIVEKNVTRFDISLFSRSL